MQELSKPTALVFLRQLIAEPNLIMVCSPLDSNKAVITKLKTHGDHHGEKVDTSDLNMARTLAECSIPHLTQKSDEVMRKKLFLIESRVYKIIIISFLSFNFSF